MDKLKLNTELTGKVIKAESRAKIYLLWLEGQDKPVIISKAVAAEDFYQHASQFVNQTITVTPTAETPQGGFLANATLPVAEASRNSLVMYKQQAAIRYQQAAQYAATADDEV